MDPAGRKIGVSRKSPDRNGDAAIGRQSLATGRKRTFIPSPILHPDMTSNFRTWMLAGGLATGLLSPSSTFSVSAHEEPFGYLRGAQSEQKGEWEVTQWTTARIGKESGRYLGMDFATELEYGITDRFQAALYLTSNYHLLKDSTGSSETFDDRNRFGLSGTSLELKYQLADPYKQWAGFSFYFEPGYSTIDRVSGERNQEVELELRLIAQKNFFDHRLIAVVNYILEPEFEHETGHDWETSLSMEWSAGLSWKFNDHWRIGAETRLVTEFEDADLNHAEHLTFYAGPNIHYSRGTFFATLAVLPQLRGWPNHSGVAGLHLDDSEKLQIRLKLGGEF